MCGTTPQPQVSMIRITADEIRVFVQYIYKVSGIILDDSTAHLLESRLAGLLQAYACESFLQLYRKAVADFGKTLERKIIDAVTTNETLFFRDHSPFEMLRHKILPELIDRRTAGANTRSPVPIRIWSAACSTGQEVYSIAMVLKETLGDLQKYKIRLLGTDISDAAIMRASYGHYRQFEIERGLAADKRYRYFERNGDGWKVRDEIRAMALFKRLNLMEPLNGLGTFDIVFCRNVGIYFGQKDRKTLFEKIADVMAKQGVLIIGSSETLQGVTSRLQPEQHLRSVFYQRVD